MERKMRMSKRESNEKDKLLTEKPTIRLQKESLQGYLTKWQVR
jgi:hypothetical protein